MTDQQRVDTKIVERVRKLLALSASGSGATENEASTAAAMAAALMEEHGLEMARVVAAGGEGESREDDTRSGGAFHYYQEELMGYVAESCFCYVETTWTTNAKGDRVRDGFRLIGRKSAVASARVLHDYLDKTIMRLSKEAKPEVPKWFRRGMAERIGERLRDRHRETLRRQEAEAEAERERQRVRATHPGSAPTGTALVVTLQDYQRDEEELNTDVRLGRAPGTTRKRREEAEAKAAETERRIGALQAEGHSFNVAYWMVVSGNTLEEAQTREASVAARQAAQEESAPETEAQRARRLAREERRDERQREEWRREQRKRSSSSWRTGRQVAENVGLDKQVDSRKQERLR